ncbi:hypothetical protein A2U01_0037298 [Trifolium medium]|uniref:Uncharacterized protein n=1 Tax=Trifolium medium TaxID=97028 RepID=A0A392PWU9_9FABA|nr:hypothetical protein [Trifolium medium]
MDGGSSFQQIPEPSPEMVMPLRFAEPIPPTITDLDQIPLSPLTLVPIPEQEASSARDDDSIDWILDSPGDDGSGSDHNLTSDCEGLCESERAGAM